MAQRKCPLCKRGIKEIDFRNTTQMTHFLTPWAKIKRSHDSGACSKHQRRLTHAIKQARFMALVPYTAR